MDLGKNIFETEKKKKVLSKILIIFGLVVLSVALFFGVMYYLNNQTKVSSNLALIDEYFIGFTAKNAENFEDPTLNNSNYSNTNNAGGYFYENDILSVTKINDEIKILSTLDYMLVCYLTSPEKNGCGITYNSKTEKFSVSKKEVSKYMKLLYGPTVSYEDQSTALEYNQIKNLNFINDKYLFEKQLASTVNLIEKYYYNVISKNADNENEIIITKAVAYFEEVNNNGTAQIDVYRFDNKTEKLGSFAASDAKKSINDFLISDLAPLYQITFDRHPEDGRYIFKSIGPIN